jgi:hypothetical protein
MYDRSQNPRQSIGKNKFQSKYAENFQQTMVTDTKSMCDTLPDTQTVTQIYKKCLVARVLFQLIADILTNANPTNLPENNLEWSSPLMDAVRQNRRDILGHATDLDHIPEYALGRNGMYAGMPPQPRHHQPRTDRCVIIPPATLSNNPIRHNRSAAAT